MATSRRRLLHSAYAAVRLKPDTPAIVIAAVVATFQAHVSAQFPKPNPFTCPKRFESEDQWIRRCHEEEERENDRQYRENAERRSREMMQQLQETDRRRALLEKQPPLPVSRNRLIGRWRSPTRPASSDPFAQLAAMTTGCGVLIGDSVVEFEPTRWAMYDEDGRNDMGAVEYRGDANGSVFVLPAKGGVFNLLPFEFETPDRIHLIGVGCTLVRANAAVPAGRAAPASSPPSRGAAPRSAIPPAAPAAPVAGTGLLMIRDRMGYQCPDGTKLAVDSCFSDADDAHCSVVRVDLPPRNGLEVTFIETRGVLKKRVAGCTQRRLVLDASKNLALAP